MDAGSLGLGKPSGPPCTRPTFRNQGQARSKRGKYTPIACERCKNRKTKCVPSIQASGDCQSCINSGARCIYTRTIFQKVNLKTKNQQIQALNDQVNQLQQHLSDLSNAVGDIKENVSSFHKIPASLDIGTSAPPHSTASPITDTALDDYWSECSASKLARLLTIWQEEVHCIYPFTEIGQHVAKAQDILDHINQHSRIGDSEGSHLETPFSEIDLNLAQIAMATGLVLESYENVELSAMIVESVKRKASRVSKIKPDLANIQLQIMLSVYYFHCGEDLLAWRTIGLAVREALEMGLHRKDTVLYTFSDPTSRRSAIRVFWCVYVLDRRWSFGTSLPFALADRDIDPSLPEPDDDSEYLQCMVGYGRLYSKLWEAILPFNSCPQQIQEATVARLDEITQTWQETVPSNLRLRGSHMDLVNGSQPPVLHRLRTLLYLRGNHIRCLIHRQYLLNASIISSNIDRVKLVVDIALDSIQVIVHLNETTDIDSRQQTAFQYFLHSSLAIVVLAVCLAPKVFIIHCRKGFYNAVAMVRKFSQRSLANRKLWKSIRVLLPRLKRLGLRSPENIPRRQNPMDVASLIKESNYKIQPKDDRSHAGFSGLSRPEAGDGPAYPNEMQLNRHIFYEADFTDPIHYVVQIESSLLFLYDVFGQDERWSQNDEDSATSPETSESGLLGDLGDEISRCFQALI